MTTELIESREIVGLGWETYEEEGVTRARPRRREFDGATPFTTMLTIRASAPKDKPEPGTLDFIATAETVDSYGDIVKVSGWDMDRFKKNSPFLEQHAMGLVPLGRVRKWWKTQVTVRGEMIRALAMRVEFALDVGSPAQQDRVFTYYDMYRAGFMKAVSVTFLPKEWKRPKDDEEREKLGLGKYGVLFTKQEMIELSAVSVGANADALKLAFGENRDRELETSTRLSTLEGQLAETRRLLEEIRSASPAGVAGPQSPEGDDAAEGDEQIQESRDSADESAMSATRCGPPEDKLTRLRDDLRKLSTRSAQ